MEGKINFSRRLKRFDGLTWLTLTPLFYDRSTPPAREMMLLLFENSIFYFQECFIYRNFSVILYVLLKCRRLYCISLEVIISRAFGISIETGVENF